MKVLKKVSDFRIIQFNNGEYYIEDNTGQCWARSKRKSTIEKKFKNILERQGI